MEAPKTLQLAIQYFSDPDNCVRYMAEQRWPDGVVVCPTCGRKDVTWLSGQRKWQCKSKHEKRQFSAKVGTIFEDSPIGLDKWLMAMWMIVNCKNGVSSYEIARSIGVTQKSAWFMMHRIRLAMDDSLASGKLGGEGKTVQADETFIGGQPKNWHNGTARAEPEGNSLRASASLQQDLRPSDRRHGHVRQREPTGSRQGRADRAS